MAICRRCGGTGQVDSEDGKTDITCPECGGEGSVEQSEGEQWNSDYGY